MTDIFLKFLNISISASYLIIFIIFVKMLMKKAPKWLSPILWGIAAVRLVLPFSIESIFSLMPKTTITNQGFNSEIHIFENIPDVSSNASAATETINHAAQTIPHTISLLTVISYIWVAGMIIMALYAVFSYMKLKNQMRTAVRMRDNIYQSEAVYSPFVLGLFKPKIYLPFKISEKDITYVVAHEKAHIRRLDHWWKPLGFLLLSVYWFNPLIWVAYVFLCKDIELACDEKVIREMDINERADYSQALLECSIKQRGITACPLAFGEVSVKERVKNVLNYKKPAFWIILLSLALCVIASICFLTSPKSPKGKIMANNIIYYEQEYRTNLPNHSKELDRIKTLSDKSVPTENFEATGLSKKYVGMMLYENERFPNLLFAFNGKSYTSFNSKPSASDREFTESALKYNFSNNSSAMTPYLYGEMEPKEIAKLEGLIKGLGKLKRNDEYNGFTPYYSISIALKSGEFMTVNGYSLTSNQTDIVYKDRHYIVEDEKFASYLKEICEVHTDNENYSHDKAAAFAETWKKEYEENLLSTADMLLGEAKAFLLDITGDGTEEIFFITDNYSYSVTYVYDISKAEPVLLGSFPAQLIYDTSDLVFQVYESENQRILRTEIVKKNSPMDKSVYTSETFVKYEGGKIVYQSLYKIRDEKGFTIFYPSPYTDKKISEEKYNSKIKDFLGETEYKFSVILPSDSPVCKFTEDESLVNYIENMLNGNYDYFIDELIQNKVITAASTPDGFEIRLVLQSGKYFKNTDEITGGGVFDENYLGFYAVEVYKDGEFISKIESFQGNEPFNFEPDFEINFADYNGDGSSDFTLGQYFSDNIWQYIIFSVNEKGHISILPLEEEIFSEYKGISPLFETDENGKIIGQYYNNSKGLWESYLYKLDSKKDNSEKKYYNTDELSCAVYNNNGELIYSGSLKKAVVKSEATIYIFPANNEKGFKSGDNISVSVSVKTDSASSKAFGLTSGEESSLLNKNLSAILKTETSDYWKLYVTNHSSGTFKISDVNLSW